MTRTIAVLGAMLALVAACNPIEQQSSLVKPPATGKPYLAGVGDIVMDLKRLESLPNVAGKADVFGRTRDTGRVTVRLVSLEGNRAVFVRQDVTIEATTPSYPIQAGQIQLAAPIGGSVLVEGRRIRVIRAVDGGIEYAVD